jgi:hypothetical protein
MEEKKSPIFSLPFHKNCVERNSSIFAESLGRLISARMNLTKRKNAGTIASMSYEYIGHFSYMLAVDHPKRHMSHDMAA